jgi:hypothetical protein
MKSTLLKLLRRVHAVIEPERSAFGRNWHMFPVKEYASQLISEAISSPAPLMVARLGANELGCMVNYLGVSHPEKYKTISGFITNQTPPWWWNQTALSQMQTNAGFFPATVVNIERFCESMINDLAQVDILGSWLKHESFFSSELASSKKVMLEDLEPFFCGTPWTHALAGKKVLVVHPFVDTIQSQYAKRELIFPCGLLPVFQLQVIPAVQSLGGNGGGYPDWFAALDAMKHSVDGADFDVCILGCGAYGFPLAAHIKRQGRKAIHLGGVTQMLFGIKGKRWEEHFVYPYTNLFNVHWVRPSSNETPTLSQVVEGGCYW